METLWSLGHKKNRSVDKNLYDNQVILRITEDLQKGGSENDWVLWKSGWTQWKNLSEVPELLNEIHVLLKLKKEEPIPNSEAPPLDSIPPLPASIETEKSETLLVSGSTKTMGQKHQIPITGIPPTSPSPTPLKSTSVSPLSQDQNISQSNAAGTSQPSSTTSQPQPPSQWKEHRKHIRVDVRLRCIIRSETMTFRTFTKDVSLGGVALEDSIPTEFFGSECNIYITATHIKKNLKFKIKMTSRPGSRFFSFESADEDFKNELNLWLEEYLHAKKENQVS